MPDPNIQEALEEINLILRGRDLAGVILVASPSHTHFDLKLDASWNAIRFERDPEGNIALRVRLKSSEYPSKEIAKKVGELTAGTLLGFLDVIDHVRPKLGDISERIARELNLVSHVSKDEGPDLEGSKRQPLLP
jgi:hypothetical protein